MTRQEVNKLLQGLLETTKRQWLTPEERADYFINQLIPFGVLNIESDDQSIDNNELRDVE